MALPEVLTIGAAIPQSHLPFTTIPVDFAGLEITATPTTIPIHLEKIAAFDFLDEKSHRNQVFFNLGALHQLIELGDFLIGSINVDDENLLRING
jgi:hypothetical protein